jgi:dihydroneopterin aldolase
MGHPIDEYVEALKKFMEGKREEAAEQLAKSLGGEKATKPILDSLELIFDKEKIIHGAVLDTIVAEVRRRRKYGEV